VYGIPHRSRSSSAKEKFSFLVFNQEKRKRKMIFLTERRARPVRNAIRVELEMGSGARNLDPLNPTKN
jgi:hypothetical protein